MAFWGVQFWTYFLIIEGKFAESEAAENIFQPLGQVCFPSNELSSILWPCRKGTGWWPICRGFLIAFRTPKSCFFFRFWKIFWKHMEVKSPCWPFFWEDREMFPVTGVWVSSLSRTRNIFCSTLGTCHCWDGKLNGRTQTTWNPWLSEDMWSFLHENIWFEHVWTI